MRDWDSLNRGATCSLDSDELRGEQRLGGVWAGIWRYFDSPAGRSKLPDRRSRLHRERLLVSEGFL